MFEAKQLTAALTVKETELATMRRLGADEEHTLVVQGNLANVYLLLHRYDESLRMRQDTLLASVRTFGEEHERTLGEANNQALLLGLLHRHEEAVSVYSKIMPVSRRVLGKDHPLTLRIRGGYAGVLCSSKDATLDDLGEAVTTLEDTTGTARRVMGGANPITVGLEKQLRQTREKLRAHEKQ